MNDYFPPPEFLLQIESAVAMTPPREEFTRGLRERLRVRGFALLARNRMRVRLAWGLAVVLVLLAAGILIAGPQNVVSALQQILGYIPGIGIVQPGSIRVLAEPVYVTREGITLTLEQVVADPSQTIVVYKVEGLLRGGGQFQWRGRSGLRWAGSAETPERNRAFQFRRRRQWMGVGLPQPP